MADKIIRNAARCKKCGDVIESKHRHDFVSCKCGAIAVDGGTDYIRWVFNDRDDIEDLCEVEDESK
jgi:ribosomal protein S27AE